MNELRTQTQLDSAELNIRGMDPGLVEQVKIAAVRRGGRAALRSWVTEALARALRLEQEPAQRPRLFLCARCVDVNRKRAADFPGGQPHAPIAPLEGESGVRTGIPGSAAPASIAKLLERVRSNSEITNEPGANSNAATPGAAAPLPRAADVPSAGNTENQQPTSSSLPSHRAVEVTARLWVGTDQDYEGLEAAIRQNDQPDAWSFLSAAKEPWHRRMVGYQTSSAPEGDERLFAIRRGIPEFTSSHMALNLIDVRELGPGGAHYIPEAVLTAGIDFLTQELAAGKNVLVHAGSGMSRAPLVAMAWMRRQGLLPQPWGEAQEAFRVLYPRFTPGAGVRRYLELAAGADVSALPPATQLHHSNGPSQGGL